MTKLNKIREMIKKEGIDDDVEYLGKWKNYEVYAPFFKDKKIKYTGLPYQILAKDDEIRWAEPEECLEIIDFFFSETEED